MRFVFLIMFIVFLFLAACQNSKIPYQSVLDTKPLRITGAVAGHSLPPQPAPSSDVPLPAQQEEQPLQPSCQDSDYGDNPTAQGTVSGILTTGNAFSHTDDCFGNLLVENNCEENQPVNKKVRCERGCTNGFCV